MIDDTARIAGVRTEPYRLPMVRPWRTARGEIHCREGWLVSLRDEDGGGGLGECAPLPAAGSETPARAVRDLRLWRGRLPGMTIAQAWEELDARPPAPSVRCAIETALLDMVSRRRGIPAARLLNPAARATVAVNASVGSADDGLAPRAGEAVGQGFEVIKIKLGAGGASREAAALRAAAAVLPSGTAIRLDANGAWDRPTASRWLEVLGDLPVECLEEPLAEPNAADLEWLQRQVPWPIALDESLGRFLAAGSVADLPVRRIVIKPMVLGGPRPAMRLAEEANRQVVVTTTLDAAPGRWIAAHLAAALDSGFAHGLDTGGWLAEDVGSGPEIRRGHCTVFS